MKALNKISQIAAVVFGLGALVMFFLPFVDVYSKGELAGSTSLHSGHLLQRLNF